MTGQPQPCGYDGSLSVDVIDQIGGPRIAKALGISAQAVRKWRRNGQIPVERQDAIRDLLAEQAEQAEQVAVATPIRRVAATTEVAPHRVSSATKTDRAEPSIAKPAKQPLAVAAAAKPTLDEVRGRQAGATMRLLIAAREVDQTRHVVDKAAAAADGLPPRPPMPFYKARLAVLFALDFPILTMAFVTVTQVSPIIAAGSAIALSLGLVLCAHAAGGRLRRLASYLRPWACDVIGLAIMLALIGAVLAVATDLRLKGFEIDGQLLASAKASLFDGGQDTLSELPESLAWAVVRAAGLVTLLLTIFGISWSYQRHGPQQDFARAEAAYRRALRRYARAVRGCKRLSIITTSLAALSMMTAPVDAASCGGPTVLALIDTTTVYDDQDRAVIEPAIDRMVRSLPDGARLTIRTVRSTPASSQLLLDRCRPPAPRLEWTVDGVWRWLTTGPDHARSAEANFLSSVRAAVLPQIRVQGDASGTALLATLSEAVSSLPELTSIWLFSDLLESVALSPRVLLSDPDSLLDDQPSLPSLPGVSVYVAGVGRFHDEARRPLSSAEYGALIDSWAGFVQRAGAAFHVADGKP